MRKLYYAITEDDQAGEVEGMFDADGTMLGMWCSNDATWRNEYFEDFMRRLGHDMRPAPKWMVDNLIKAAIHKWS